MSRQNSLILSRPVASWLEHEGDAMKLYSEMWMSAVDNMLKRGFGVEDIGLKMKCHPDKVRTYVRCLRQIGTLRAWWP